MAVKLHNIPKAATEDKVTNVVIEHGVGRGVFGRIRNSNIIDVVTTPNLNQAGKVYRFMLTVAEFREVIDNLDLEEFEFEEDE